MVHRLRQLLLVLTAFAFIGGTSSPRTAAYAAPMMMAGMPCGMMMAQAGMHSGKPMPPSSGQPCKGMTADCIRHMGCVTDAALPARTMSLDPAAQFSNVDYWPVWSRLADFVREPDPLPPRTI